MTRYRRLLLITAGMLTLTAFRCSDDTVTWRSFNFKTQDLSREPAEVPLRAELFEKIEELGRVKVEASAKGGHGGGHEAAAPEGGGEHGAEHGAEKKEGHKAIVATVFAPLTVYLYEKNPGILVDGNAKIEFGPGGGEMDLRDYVAPHNGSFYFVADFVPDFKDATRSVFFMSNGLERSIDGQSYGAGCDTYFDVTTAFHKANEGSGFLINTTEGRHVTALAGHYFFAAPRDGKLYIASLTIKDSSHKALQCKRQPLKSESSAE